LVGATGPYLTSLIAKPKNINLLTALYEYNNFNPRAHILIRQYHQYTYEPSMIFLVTHRLSMTT